MNFMDKKVEGENFFLDHTHVILDYRTARDRRLSYEAKGLLVDILSRSRKFDLPLQFFVIEGKTNISKIKRLYKELSEWSKEVTREEEEREKRVEKEPVENLEVRETIPGYIYFLKGDRYIKIGRTTNLENRMEQLGILLPFKVELIHSIESEDMYGDEKRFHKLYEGKRVNGEWFELSDDDMKEIKSL